MEWRSISNRMRNNGYEDFFESIYTIMSVLLWIGIGYYAIFPAGIARPQFAISFIGYAMVLYIVYIAAGLKEDESRYPSLEVALLLIAAIYIILTSIYMYVNYEELRIIRVGYSYWYEYYIAGAFLFILGYLLYREYGKTFISVLIIAFLYGWAGPYLPGIWSHAGLSILRMLHATFLDIAGVYGNIVVIVGTWIAPFLLFSGLAQAFGAFNLIIRAAMGIADYIRSGVAQTAVVGSLVIGSINGAAVANAGISGSVTIPIMKENGIESRKAAAIESVASSGGQIMPPIMGASAFIMANILQIPYADIIIAAVVPAVIFYILVAINVHLIVIEDIDAAMIEGMRDQLDFDIRSKRGLALESSQFIIPLAALLYLLIILRFSILYSALITAGLTLATTAVYQIGTDPTLSGVRQYLSDVVEGCKEGARITAPIGIIVSAISVIIALFMATGFPNILALTLMDRSGGLFIGAILVAFVICVILGLGMPTVGAYLLVALMVAPGIIRLFDHPELATHFFVFYAAILSALTPPIAVAVVVTAGIADSDFWPTCFYSIRVGFPLFLLPFVFMYDPVILETGVSQERVFSSISIFIGLLAISIAVNSRFPSKVTSLFISSGSIGYKIASYGIISALTLVGILITFLDEFYIRVVLIILFVAVIGIIEGVTGRIGYKDVS